MSFHTGGPGAPAVQVGPVPYERRAGPYHSLARSQIRAVLMTQAVAEINVLVNERAQALRDFERRRRPDVRPSSSDLPMPVFWEY